MFSIYRTNALCLSEIENYNKLNPAICQQRLSKKLHVMFQPLPPYMFGQVVQGITIVIKNFTHANGKAKSINRMF